MKSAGVAEIKARLSEYLKIVKAGGEVLISERGVPIARLVPLGGDGGREARRERLGRAGLLHPGRGRVRRSLLEPPRGPAALGAGVLAALLDERANGR